MDGAQKAEKITAALLDGALIKITAAKPPSNGKEKKITAVKPLPNGAGRFTSTKSLQNSAEKNGENYSVVIVTEPSTWDRKKGVQL